MLHVLTQNFAGQLKKKKRKGKVELSLDLSTHACVSVCLGVYTHMCSPLVIIQNLALGG